MQNFPFEHDGQTLWYSRSLAVSCLVYTTDIKTGELCILVNKRGQGCEFNKGLWNMPGGFIDFNETAEEAASRECYEETGVIIDPKDWQFVELDTKCNSTRQTMIARYVAYIAPYIAAKIKLTNEHSEPGEVEEIKWMPLKEVNNYTWTNRQVEPITKYAKQIIFGLNFK